MAVLADERHGPTVSCRSDRALVVHGSDLAPLDALQAGYQRFAALEWDGSYLRASRDPLGEVPLFLRFAEGAAWLASEIHPLVAVAPATLDLEALSAEAGFVPHTLRTGWEGIFRVPPGATVVIDPSMHLTVSAYWRPDQRLAKRHYQYDDAVAEFRERFEVAVARRRGPSTGILLSGGLDSAAVAVAAPAELNTPTLLTVTFPELPDTDETHFARATADSVGLPLTVLQGRTDPWDAHAEPAIFGTPSVLVPTGIFETAAAALVDDGGERMLDGHDGDGALGLYQGIYGLLVAHLEVRQLISLARRHGWRSVVSPSIHDLTPPWVRRVLGRRQAEDNLISRLLPLFRGATAQRMAGELRWRSPRASWKYYQVLALTPPTTLVFEQMETTAARLGIDLLHPFADRELLDFLISLPFSVKVDAERPKALLRDALADLLPEAVRVRSGKVSFNSVLERRVDSQLCLRWIQESAVELPDLDYQALYTVMDRDPEALTVFGCIQLARAHVFAAAA